MLENLVKTKEDGSLYVKSLDLHKYLEVKTRHNDWIKRQIKNYGLEENRDYTRYSKVSNERGGNKNIKTVSNVYELTINCAKELAMVEKTLIGRKIRRYFIEIEEVYGKQKEANLKLGSMLLTHKEKLNLTKELFYPILDRLGVLQSKKNVVHQKIIKGLFGKYENLNKLTKLTERDIENYKKLAINMQTDTRYFTNYDQITIWDIIKEI